MKKGDFIPRIKRACLCGNDFEVLPKRIQQGRGDYCSRACMYKYRVMPSKRQPYALKVINPTWFKEGHEPWCKGTKGVMCTPPNFKGDNVKYGGLHDWVQFHKGKASVCEHCGIESGRIEWANKSHQYKRDLNDWLSLCKRCHVKYDKEKNQWGTATKIFNLPKRKKRL